MSKCAKTTKPKAFQITYQKKTGYGNKRYCANHFAYVIANSLTEVDEKLKKAGITATHVQILNNYEVII